jgi:hypothetical protein
MPEGRGLWGRLLVLAAAVLALHLWLLAGLPRLRQAARPPAAWKIRNMAPPSAAAQITEAANAASPAPEQPQSNAPVLRKRPAAQITAASAGPSIAAPTREAAGVPPPAPIFRFLVPPPARWHYLVTAYTRGATTRGEAELQWRHDGNQYEAQLELDAPGLRPRVQRSTGLVTADGLAPLRFSDKSRGEEAAHFARDAGKLSFSSNRPDAPLEPGAQDRLSVILQLGAMLAADPSKFAPGTRISLQTATTREAQAWVFVVEGAEQLELPGGTTSAVKLSREPIGPYDGRLELWLAPGTAYAPARLRLTQPNGDWVDQQWSSTDSGG